ncbi:MAG: diversity-generating retroelement protein Avd [Anaerolineales bacterium]|jgi:hypothetical protein|nr:diversity-generating retroelement protein Avd [Anaerolineales bacterium]
MKQSPLFSKTYIFVAWIVPVTVKFPRQQRFVIAAALQRESLRFQELIIEAAHQREPLTILTQADAELDKVRTHLRLALDLELLKPGQYQHGATMLVEMGNLLGGWLSKVKKQAKNEPETIAETELLQAERGEPPLL